MSAIIYYKDNGEDKSGNLSDIICGYSSGSSDAALFRLLSFAVEYGMTARDLNDYIHDLDIYSCVDNTYGKYSPFKHIKIKSIVRYPGEVELEAFKKPPMRRG